MCTEATVPLRDHKNIQRINSTIHTLLCLSFVVYEVSTDLFSQDCSAQSRGSSSNNIFGLVCTYLYQHYAKLYHRYCHVFIQTPSLIFSLLFSLSLSLYLSCVCFNVFIKLKIKFKSVAYSSQGSHTGELDFCN